MIKNSIDKMELFVYNNVYPKFFTKEEKMKFARIVAMILLVATCLTMIVACNEGSDGQTTTAATTKPANPGDPNKDPQGFIKDKVPDANYDKTFTVVCWQHDLKEYDLPEPGDDADDVDIALYNRNRKVEDRLGITLKFHELVHNVDTFVEDVHTSVGANLGAYDMVSSYSMCGGILSVRGDYVNLYDVEYIDTDMPWYPEEIVSENTIADNLFVVTGDIATSLIYQMEFMVINQDYAEEFGIDVPELQNLALAGGWTFDKMLEITSNCYQDVDDTSGKSKGDRFGLVVQGHPLYDQFYIGAGLSYVDQTEDGFFLSDDYGGQVSRAILTKFADAYKTNNAYWYGEASPMSEGKSLLYAALGAYLAGDFRSATFMYHILPAPKYFAEEEYYTAIQYPHSLYAIPKDVKDRSISGAVFEVMSSESHRQVTPVLFDKVFLYKYTNSEIDMQILTLIRDRTKYDVGRMFYTELGAETNPVIIWRRMIINKSSKLEGQINVNKTRWNNVLKTIYDTLDAVEN